MADMICEQCGGSDAVVHLTQIVNNEMSMHHLCERCAAEKGLQTPPATAGLPVSEFIAQMAEETPTAVPATDTTCAFCGLTFKDFRKSGRLGCPQCYEAFSGHLESLLRKIHGNTRHVGKVYLPPDPSASEMEKRLEGLKRRLERAVRAEDFERAAELRDQIRTLEPA
jgi:protein arginine kinase activator